MLSKKKDYQMTKLLIQFLKENELLDWEKEEFSKNPSMAIEEIFHWLLRTDRIKGIDWN